MPPLEVLTPSVADESMELLEAFTLSAVLKPSTVFDWAPTWLVQSSAAASTIDGPMPLARNVEDGYPK